MQFYVFIGQCNISVSWGSNLTIPLSTEYYSYHVNNFWRKQDNHSCFFLQTSWSMDVVWLEQCLAKDLIFIWTTLFRPCLYLGTFTLENILGRSPLILCLVTWCFITLNFALAILLTTFNLICLKKLQSLPSLSALIILYISSFIWFFIRLFSPGFKSFKANLPFSLFVNSPGSWWMRVADFSFQPFRSLCGCSSFSFVGRLATAGFVESESKRKTKKTPLSPTRGIAQLVTDSEGVCLYSLFNKTL